MYAWGSAVYWKKINSQLDVQHLSDIYDVINWTHHYGWSAIVAKNDLDRVLEVYEKLDPLNYEYFRGLVTKYFRNETLVQLTTEALARQREIGCNL